MTVTMTETVFRQFAVPRQERRIRRRQFKRWHIFAEICATSYNFQGDPFPCSRWGLLLPKQHPRFVHVVQSSLVVLYRHLRSGRVVKNHVEYLFRTTRLRIGRLGRISASCAEAIESI